MQRRIAVVEQAILEFKNITKKYPGTVALKNVSITFEPGEVHALCGENGAGKSTLIKTCSGAITPTEGKICVNGEEFEMLTPALSQEKGMSDWDKGEWYAVGLHSKADPEIEALDESFFGVVGDEKADKTKCTYNNSRSMFGVSTRVDRLISKED